MGYLTDLQVWQAVKHVSRLFGTSGYWGYHDYKWKWLSSTRKATLNLLWIKIDREKYETRNVISFFCICVENIWYRWIS